MKKKFTSRSAFFNLRVVIGLFIAFVGVLLALLGFGTFSNPSAQPNLDSSGQGGQMKVIRTVHSDVSPPLRDQPVVWQQEGQEREPHVNPRLPIRHHDRPDPVIRSSLGQQLMTSLAISAPIRQWAGIGEECEGCLAVPDTDGAVGKTQYVEMVNRAVLQVFDKLTGTSLLGPVPIESIFTGFGGPCSIYGEGDPIVVYDRLADRWVISQFATRLGAKEPQDECIAVSQTGDATGAWYRYDFHLTFRFADYPKFGVWPDGYYMSANMFRTDPLVAMAIGAKPFVFDRAKMLVGDPTATVQTTEKVVSHDLFLPSDLDGVIPPPAGAPNFFVAVTIAVEEEETATPGGAQADTASQSIRALKPVSFRYKVHKDTTPQFGLIAEEVAQVNPELVIYDADRKPFTVRYDAVNAMLLNEFLKEHHTVQQLESTVAKQEANTAKQEATIARQQKQIEALTAGLQKVSAQVEISRPVPQTVANNQ
jgi:hypothetical protein